MTEDEKDKTVHQNLMNQFMLARTLASSLNRGHRNQELERLIIEKSIKELNFLLEKKLAM